MGVGLVVRRDQKGQNRKVGICSRAVGQKLSLWGWESESSRVGVESKRWGLGLTK